MEKRPDVIVDDAFERKPLVNVARPVCASVPVWVVLPSIESEPSCAVDAKRFVEEAVVLKRLVVVAFEKRELPETVMCPLKSDVADEDVATKCDASTRDVKCPLPVTSREYVGAALFIPTR
jgi:hypothetical protein